MAGDADGRVPVAVINERIGLGVEIETRQCPCSFQWQNFQAGHYVMAVEPATHHVKGNLFARDRDEMIWLDAGEERCYDTRVRVLDGAADIAAAQDRIAAIAIQPDSDYPPPTGKFASLYGAGDRDR